MAYLATAENWKSASSSIIPVFCSKRDRQKRMPRIFPNYSSNWHQISLVGGFNHLEKWWSSWMGRMTSHNEMEHNPNVWHQPDQIFTNPQVMPMAPPGTSQFLQLGFRLLHFVASQVHDPGDVAMCFKRGWETPPGYVRKKQKNMPHPRKKCQHMSTLPCTRSCCL